MLLNEQPILALKNEIHFYFIFEVFSPPFFTFFDSRASHRIKEYMYLPQTPNRGKKEKRRKKEEKEKKRRRQRAAGR